MKDISGVAIELLSMIRIINANPEEES